MPQTWGLTWVSQGAAFCAAWGVPSGPGSVPGFTHGARIAAARSHSLINPAQLEAEFISAMNSIFPRSGRTRVKE
jgi:hypothetical protein